MTDVAMGCILMAAGLIFAAAALCLGYMKRQREEELPIRVLHAIRDLGGRATALQIAAQAGWGQGHSPLTDVRAQLEAMIAEGVLTWEWQDRPTASTNVRPCKIYMISPRFAAGYQ